MDITESGFQTPASKKRKASGSPSLPPASKPTTPPSNYKNNKTPLVATGIDSKFNKPVKIMSELRQYHANLRLLQIKQTKTGWIFQGRIGTYNFVVPSLSEPLF